jgi:hypothetical protein
MKIIELFIPEDSFEGGVDAIAIVDKPAHESNFLTFSTDLPDVPQVEYTYIGEQFEEEEQIELAKTLNLLGEDVGVLESQGWEIVGIEVVDLHEFEKEKEKFVDIISNPNERSAEDTPREIIRYKYMLAPGFSNPIIPTSREFCVEMINANKVFRVEDIIAMSEDCVNSQFGCYNIMTWRGSFNCRHLWYKMRYRGGRGPRAGINYPIGEPTNNASWAQPSTQVRMAQDILGKDFLTKEEFGVLGVIDGQPLFSNKEDAEKLAEIIGCKGSHEYVVGDFTGYMACETHEFASYDDYPKEASENACKVLRWIDEHGRDEVEGMTQTGLARANQLCKREPISQETISRMAAFERHRKNSEISPEFKGTPWKDKGYTAWLGWGGDAGVEWASRKLEQLKTDMLYENPCQAGYVAYGTKMKNGREVPNCVKEDMSTSISGIVNDGGCCYDENLNMDILGYKTRFFHICPIAISVFTDLLKSSEIDEETEGMIRSAALQADRIFEIEDKALKEGVAQDADLTEALLLLNDFVDLMGEIAEETGKEYDLGFMMNHIEVIRGLLSDEMEIDTSGLSPYTDQTGSGMTIDSVFKHGFSYDDEKMEITGAAIIPNKMIVRRNPITEELYYVFFSEETTKLLMERFQRNSKMDATNLNHSDTPADDTYVSESWLVIDPEYDKTRALGLEYPKGTWVITMKVGNNGLWDKIKRGEYNGFSVEGWFNERVIFN